MKFIIENNKNKKILFEKALRVLKKEKFCVIKNFHPISRHKKIINYLKKKFNYKKDIRLSGPLKINRKDYQRLDIGNSYKNPRFIRTIFVNEWFKRNQIFFDLINPIMEIRNHVSKIEKIGKIYPKARSISKSLNPKKYFFCDFVRMIQYPAGGGFLAEHDDHDQYYCKGVYQALLSLTVKKRKNRTLQFATYKTGGLYLKINSKKIYIDDYINAGDLLLFDPRVTHGVESIDYKSKLNLSKLNGRLTVAFSISNFLK